MAELRRHLETNPYLRLVCGSGSAPVPSETKKWRRLYRRQTALERVFSRLKEQMELSNVANLPITLYYGMKTGQISLLRLTSRADHPYGSQDAGSCYRAKLNLPPATTTWTTVNRPGRGQAKL